jgi:membrane protease YdiL (CAAX protease family)
VLVWVASVVLLLVLPMLVIIPYALLRYRGVSYEVFASSIQSDKTAIFISILAVIPAHLLTLVVVWAAVTRLGRRPFWRTIGWRWGDDRDLWFGTASAGLAFMLLLVGVLLTKLLGGEETQIDQIIASSRAARYTTAFIATVTAPLVEETIYRGLLFPALQRAFDMIWALIHHLLSRAEARAALLRAEGKIWAAGVWTLSSRLWKVASDTLLPPPVQSRMGTIWAVIIVSGLFAFVHLFQYRNNLGVIAAITLLSVSLTLVRASTGRLMPCFVMHLVFNGLQSLLIVFEPQVQSVSAGREGQVAVILMLAHTIRIFI